MLCQISGSAAQNRYAPRRRISAINARNAGMEERMTQDRFDHWPDSLRAELEQGPISPRVGSELVSETDRVRVWHLSLKPGERIGFHRHVLDYFWTATSAGRSRSHFGDGQIIESEYETGTTRHFSFAAGESMVHDLENIGSSELTFVTIEFKNSDNAPLPLDL